MTTQTPLEMVREVVIATGDFTESGQASIRNGDWDDEHRVKIGLAMHTRLTAAHDEAVRELVEGLDKAAQELSRVILGSATLQTSVIVNRTKALIAKRRAPDAFETGGGGD